MSRLTFILRSQPGELTFIDVFRDALEQVKEQHGFEFRYAQFEQGSDDLGRHIYLETQERSILDLVEDFATPARYLIIEAATQEEVHQLGEWLEEILPFVPLRELQQEARQQIADNPQSLIRMAIGTGEIADPISLKIIRSGINNENNLIRFKALAAASLTQWVEFIPDILNLSQKDLVPEVREMADEALKACYRRLQR